uniref:Uncharacterized protein n=1 Tax=Strongyloides stercoralis TaxID=6248 RepID=A0AAF5DPM5_STRER
TMNNAASIIFIIFLGSLIFFSHGCNVKLNITNGTEKKFQLQVTALSIKLREKIVTKRSGKFRSLETKFNGNGYVRIMVGDDFRPWVNDRRGIHCSEGACM